MSSRERLLFLCTGNSCRSQMAEAWTRHLVGDAFDVHSAGIEAKGLDPRAVAVMREVGLDISSQRSKRVDQLEPAIFDVVVTVCGHAEENCPSLPGQARRVHRSFDDPPRLARSAGSEDEALEHYRRVRDEIRQFVEGFPQTLDSEAINR